MDLTGLTDDELLERRHLAFLRLTREGAADGDRTTVYEEIRRINRELVRRRPAPAAPEERPGG
ncbi:MAG TPA: hypothetical protein VIC57_00815 [Candidatus Dormibacteraeota bacterium]|jgi:hypothetical protein